MSYLAFIEHDGAAWGGFIPELHVTVAGKNREQVLERLSEGGALTLSQLAAEGRPAPAPRYRSAADLPAEDREDVEGLEPVMVELARISATSVAIAQAIERSPLSQAEVARRMETSPAAVSRMTDPFYHAHSLASLVRLAQVLHVPVTRFTGLRELALDEYLSSGSSGLYAPGHVTLKRTPELEALELPALVRWEGLWFWLDAPAAPPYAVSDALTLRFEGSEIDDQGYLKGVLSA